MNRMLPLGLAPALLSALLLSHVVAAEPAYEVRLIWDQGEHNAFTDLLRHNETWFCVFREGAGHVSPDGAIRVLTSPDGQEWTSAALLSSDRGDLRDAKISVTPDGRLMLLAAIALEEANYKGHQTVGYFSRDGRDWSEPTPVGDRNFWLWRVNWHRDRAYGLGYATASDDRLVRLYTSPDGARFETLVERLFDEGYPNESAFVFLPDDTALCLLRRDGTPNSGLLGRAKPPYTDWSWQDLGVRIGGPDLIRLDDGRLIAAVRLYDGGARTALCWLDPEQAAIEPFLTLPSGGDTSYPGLVQHEGKLWVSYYSSHEGKTNIYLATVAIPE